MTNADRIRAMSDEELAETIVSEILNLESGMRDVLEDVWLKWLQQPAEVSDQ